MSGMPPDTTASFRRRMRAYFLRVTLLLLAAPIPIYILLVLLKLFLAPETAGAVVGVLALVGVVGGAYAVHWATVRCPKCERWLVPLGVNGFAPAACPHCGVPLR